jgi:hypothetical protein
MSAWNKVEKNHEEFWINIPGHVAERITMLMKHKLICYQEWKERNHAGESQFMTTK